VRREGSGWLVGSRERLLVVFLLSPVDEHGALLRAADGVRGDQGLERRRPGRDPVPAGGFRPGELLLFCLGFFFSLAIFPTGDRLGISGLGRKASLGLMCERSVVGAGLPARRAGRLVEEPPRRGAPLQQQ